MKWHSIDTVLLDMDGTLLDLAFDSDFWCRRVPLAYQTAAGLSEDRARARFDEIFQAHKGTLNWYCTDFWTRELGIDVLALKTACAADVRFRADAPAFLRYLKDQGKRVVIATNAHPDTVHVKHEQTGVLSHVDGWHSSHEFGVAKEGAGFWEGLQATLDYDPGRTLFVDDGEPILAMAEQQRIAHLVHIASPETGQPARPSARYRSIDRFAEIADL